MTREELFDYIQKIDDPKADYSKILSNLHYTHYFLMDRYKKLFQPYGLTSVQVNILGIIAFHYPKAISLEEIKVMVLEQGSDVSRTVTRLAAKGFIRKVIDPENRRKRSIVATEKGVKTIDAIDNDSKLQKFTDSFTLEEAHQFVKFLHRLRT